MHLRKFDPGTEHCHYSKISTPAKPGWQPVINVQCSSVNISQILTEEQQQINS